MAGINALVLANTLSTTITNLDDGVDGQLVTLISTNANTTISDVSTGSSFQLEGGINFTLGADDTLTLVRFGAVWYEVSRALN